MVADLRFHINTVASTLALATCVVSTAYAYDMTEIHSLNFGTFAVVDNNSPHSIIVPYDGSPASYDPEIVANTDPQRGEYALENLPANITFYVGVEIPDPGEGGLTLDNPTSMSGAMGPNFTLSSFTASDVTTDSNGDATLYIGATLTTSGTGAMYTSDTFSGEYDITFYY